MIKFVFLSVAVMAVNSFAKPEMISVGRVFDPLDHNIKDGSKWLGLSSEGKKCLLKSNVSISVKSEEGLPGHYEIEAPENIFFLFRNGPFKEGSIFCRDLALTNENSEFKPGETIKVKINSTESIITNFSENVMIDNSKLYTNVRYEISSDKGTFTIYLMEGTQKPLVPMVFDLNSDELPDTILSTNLQEGRGTDDLFLSRLENGKLTYDQIRALGSPMFNSYRNDEMKKLHFEKLSKKNSRGKDSVKKDK